MLGKPRGRVLTKTMAILGAMLVDVNGSNKFEMELARWTGIDGEASNSSRGDVAYIRYNGGRPLLHNKV